MEITELLKAEQNNMDAIHLYKEGIFWRVYENSAILFCENIKNYSIQKKFVKKVNREILYLGFPDSALSVALSLAKEKNLEIETFEKFITIKGNFLIPDFQQKRIETPFKDTINKVVIDNLFLLKLKDFPVLLRTPLQCQQFIVELQNEINGSI